jgi:hypothetical protein
MNKLGRLYIRMGEPEGPLCGGTCEVDDWAADEIERLRAELDALRGQEPVAWIRKYGFRFNRDIEPEGDGEVPLYAAPKPGKQSQGTAAWADVPNATQWLEELRGNTGEQT